jgi:hypothetical protein
MQPGKTAQDNACECRKLIRTGVSHSKERRLEHKDQRHEATKDEDTKAAGRGFFESLCLRAFVLSKLLCDFSPALNFRLRLWFP